MKHSHILTDTALKIDIIKIAEQTETTIPQIAMATGIPTSTLYSWQHNANGITYKRVLALTKFFGCVPEDLFYG